MTIKKDISLKRIDLILVVDIQNILQKYVNKTVHVTLMVDVKATFYKTSLQMK